MNPLNSFYLLDFFYSQSCLTYIKKTGISKAFRPLQKLESLSKWLQIWKEGWVKLSLTPCHRKGAGMHLACWWKGKRQSDYEFNIEVAWFAAAVMDQLPSLFSALLMDQQGNARLFLIMQKLSWQSRMPFPNESQTADLFMNQARDQEWMLQGRLSVAIQM